MKEDLQKAYKVERKKSPNLIVQQELKVGRQCHPRSDCRSEYIWDIGTNRSILKTAVLTERIAIIWNK